MFYGYLPPKKDLRDYKVCASNVQIEYPKEFVLSNLPKVKNQGDTMSCAAHATSSILEYYDKNRHDLSTNFIYGIQKRLCGHEGKGMYLADCGKIVQTYGDMLEEHCSGNDEVPKCWELAENCLTDRIKQQTAYEFRASQYYECVNANDIKYALMNYGPVLTAVLWRNNYTIDNDGVIHFDMKSEAGGHALVIYGWSEKGWLIQNSWGTSFGKNGRFTLPFDYGLLESRVIIDYPNDCDVALVRPKNNKFLNPIYKLINYIINRVKKDK